MRTVAVTQDDPFFTGRFFETFLRQAPHAGVELVEVVVLPNFRESRVALARRLAGFYGPVGLLRLGGRYVSALIDERRGYPRSVTGVATRHGVPVRRLTTVNDVGYLRTLAERRIDVLLSVAAPEILGREALSAAPQVLNVHNGRLPDYRGMMPTFWALLDGEDEVTVTVHEMLERVDAGGVLMERRVPIGPTDSAFAVAREAKAVAGEAVAELLSRLGTDRWPAPRPLDMTTGRYRPFPARGDVRRLQARGRAAL